MNFKDETFSLVTFEEFCVSHSLVVTVRERGGESGDLRYFATCDGVEVRDDSDGMLVGAFGNGATREGAVLSYSRRLAGQKIVAGAMTSQRREMQCPNEWRESP